MASSESSVDVRKTEEDFPLTKIGYRMKIQVILSELGFIILMGFTLLLIYVIPQYHSERIFTSKNKSNFEFNNDPIILLHTTDIHISENRKQRTDGSSIFLMSLCEYNPDLVLLTGDYIDNVKKGDNMGMQNLEEWKIYNSSIKNVLLKKGFKVVDISGNHDQWAVDKFDSEENHFLDNSFIYNRINTKNESDFFLKKIKLNINNNEMNFLLIHDYRYPVYRAPYGAETHTTIEQLDLLEKTINSMDENEILALSHYPVDRALLYKSTEGNSFDKIISNKKIYAIFTGHEHPDNVRIIHHGAEGGLEFCTPSAFDKKRAGLITYDNGNLFYHEVYIPYYGSKPLCFMTYPIPKEQISSHHFFNLKSFDIRVISYHPDKNIKLKIEGDIKGNLEYDHTLKNGALLYKYHIKALKEGNYKIHIYDEIGLGCDINTEFFIGEKYTGKKEKYIGRINFRFAIRFLIIPFFIYLLIIVFPFFPNLNFFIVKNIENSIEDISEYNKTNKNKILLYIYLIILSPFFLRWRFQSASKVNIILRYAIFIAFIYPLILPVHFMERIKGKIIYSFLVFIVMDNKIKYEHWALQFTFIYYATTLFPFILFASGKKFYNKNNKIIMIINGFLSILLWIISMIINFSSVGQSISFGFLFFSTAFVYIFIILLILFIIYFPK